MTTIGTPFTDNATRLMLLGSGELGREVALEAMRYGVMVIAVDSYANAPAMQFAQRSYVIDMLDGEALREIIEKEEPNYIVPEIEAIATDTLLELESEGHKIIPTARAARLTMDREGIRRLIAEELQLLTSPYRFAETKEEYLAAVDAIGMPCVVKPVMSSSGKGQSTIRDSRDIDSAWEYSQEGGRAGGGRIIVEGFIDFDYEITLLTVKHKDGISFCAPVGHRQEDGDYRESWQPQAMSEQALEESQKMAAMVVNNLAGTEGMGLFGVEFFIKVNADGDDLVYFSELSPRPHDTGMVTLISQNLSQFALHTRAILGLPIPEIKQLGFGASHVILVEGESKDIQYCDLEDALVLKDTEVRIFGKPEVNGKRRMGVGLALANNTDDAREKAKRVVEAIRVKV